MSYALDQYSSVVAAEASADARATFIKRTYGHLALAILAFAGLEALLIRAIPAEMILGMMTGYSWLIVMVAFMGVSYLADNWARSNHSVGLQYAGLGVYVAAQAFIFLPLIYVATTYFGPELIPNAGILTLTIFGGLTLAVFLTGSDFSYLRTILSVGSMIALGVIVAAIVVPGGVSLGLWFSVAMVVLACGFILYSTSNVLHHYRTDQHVAAALALFASVALLFWYILQILMSLNRRN
jgi:FtsH-binding integral membrane protein